MVAGCNSNDKPTAITTSDFNIKVTPDLSNRIINKNYIKPDEFIIQQFIDLLYPDIINDDKKINQYDVFTLDFISKMDIKGEIKPVTIDLKRFGKDQQKRNEYIGYKNDTSGFEKDKLLFVNTASEQAKEVNTNNDHGADIYEYLKDLNSIEIDTSSQEIVGTDGQVIHNITKNVIILLTDGYIETSTGNNNAKMSNSLSENKIQSFRKDYLKNGKGMTVREFFRKNGYGITPINNDFLKQTRILVLQLFDRGETAGGNKNGSLTDLEIIKLFWKDWFIESGLKPENIGLYSCYETYDELSTKTVLKSFLQIK
jgi:hypothetical protein